MKVGLVGAGLIGQKRAKVILGCTDDTLVGVVDKNLKAAKEISSLFSYDVPSFSDYNELLKCTGNKINVLIVSVPNQFILPIATLAARKGIHILSEKPLGRNADEAYQIVQQCREHKVLIKTGFNHRYHPAVLKAKEYIEKGSIGKILHIRGRYGHGGRPGMEKEWRVDREICGGGELLDQGVHLIDLAACFLGNICRVFGKVITEFWEIEVEDNAYFLLEAVDNSYALFHVSWTNWKNIFSFEIFGDKGYIEINGLGGSYGTETLTLGLRNSKGGKPQLHIEEFPEEDKSWVTEWNLFKSAIHEKCELDGDGYDGYKANKIVEAIYKSSRFNCFVEVNN